MSTHALGLPVGIPALLRSVAVSLDGGEAARPGGGQAYLIGAQKVSCHVGSDHKKAAR